MASIVREVVIDAPASACWDALSAFGAVHERLAKGFVTDAKLVGNGEREVTFFTGAVAREKQVGVDDESMRLAYTVIDSPLGSSHHNASAQIVPAGNGQCRFVWITDVLPDELADQIAGLMDAGLSFIRETLEAIPHG
jgi:hypothetical protein